MVAPALIAAAVSGLGSLFGGRSRKKASKRAEKIARQQGDEVVAANAADQTRAVQQQVADQARAIQYRDADEARLRENTGMDFKKLRDDARAAGFNPLTVLGATGGAGYDRASAVMSTPFLATPFIGTAEAQLERANLITGGATNRIAASGYVGDTIAGMGAAYFDQKRSDDLIRLDYDRLAQERALMGQSSFGGRAVGYNAGYGTGMSAGTIFDQNTPSSDNSSWLSRLASKGRDIVMSPLQDVPGFIRVQNGFGTTYVPGSDGDPWGFDEWITVLGAQTLEHPGGTWNALGGLNPDGTRNTSNTGVWGALTTPGDEIWNMMGGLNRDGSAVKGRSGIWGALTTPLF